MNAGALRENAKVMKVYLIKKNLNDRLRFVFDIKNYRMNNASNGVDMFRYLSIPSTGDPDPRNPQ